MKQFILVAGIDYENLRIDYRDFCITRVLELYELFFQQDDLLFKIFDFKKGTIEVMKSSKLSGAITAPHIIKTFRPIRNSDYDGGFILKRISGTLSIVDVYKAVIDIGTDAPGELEELSFFYLDAFSTDNFDLVRTLLPEPISKKDKIADEENFRLPGDIDPFIFFDFDAPRMDDDQLEKFTKAFSENGYCWLWGGHKRQKDVEPRHREEAMFDLFTAMTALPEFQSPDLTDETILVFPKVNKTIFDEVARQTKRHYDTVPDRKNMRLPFGFVKYLLVDDLRGCTANQLAHQTGIKTFGLVLPANSIEETGKTFNLFQAPDKFKNYIRFCKEQFGLNFDPDRFYSEFDDSLTFDVPELNPDVFHIPKTPASVPSTQPASNPATLPTPATQPTPASLPSSISTSQPSTLSTSQPSSNPTSQPVKKSVKEFVLIAGFDFETAGINFLELCQHRITKIIAGQEAPLRFQIFDFTSGKITTILKENKSSPSLSSTEEKYEAVKITDYKRDEDNNGRETNFYKEKSPKKTVMNMQEVYDRIIKMGKDSPGQLMEFSFFCHGDEFGPRTLNFKPEPPFALSPDSGTWEFYDPFHPFDFSLPMMSKDDLGNFQKAFHEKGYSWIWGYNSSAGVQKMVSSIFKNKDYKSGLPLDTVLTFKNPLQPFRRFIARLTGKEIDPFKVPFLFGFLIRQLSVVLKSSYMYHLSRATQKDVYGGLPGVNAELETTSTTSLMRIDTVAYKEYLKFFKDNFGFDLDPEKRGYGKYIKKFPWDKVDFPGAEFEESFDPNQ